MSYSDKEEFIPVVLKRLNGSPDNYDLSTHCNAEFSPTFHFIHKLNSHATRSPARS